MHSSFAMAPFKLVVVITSPYQAIITRQALAVIPNFTLISSCYCLSTASASTRVLLLLLLPLLLELVSSIINFTRQATVVASSSTSRATAVGLVVKTAC